MSDPFEFRDAPPAPGEKLEDDPKTESKVNEAARKYSLSQDEFERVKKERDMARKTLEQFFDVSTPGHDSEQTTEEYEITCKVPRVLSWDSDMLESIAVAGKHAPPYVKTRHSIPAAEWDKLNHRQQDELRPALTIKAGTAKLEVKRR